MLITVQQLEKIVAAGGGLILSANGMAFHQIREIVTAANVHGAGITLKNVAALTPAQLEELAGLAPALITFDLTVS
jgi:hypothetical protein